jgi:hypothetical protein
VLVDGYFRRVVKIAKGDYQLRYVCPAEWENSAPNGTIFMKIDTLGFFEILSRKLKFYYDLTRVKNYKMYR